MYSTCLFCAASLGTNEAIEAFPVGRGVAFDAWHGRLWAVCRRCGRWNLAPLEERWEVVEAAERMFTDARTRVHSENIGLCRLPDGTRLVRVGKALPNELAAWRYGRQLVSRRRRNLVVTTAGAAGALGAAGIYVGLPFILGAGTPLLMFNAAFQIYTVYTSGIQQRRVVMRVPPEQSPTGGELVIRRQHLHESVLAPSEGGGLAVRLPSTHLLHPWKQPAAGWSPAGSEPFEVTGQAAQRLLARVMTDYNASGARHDDVERALATIVEAGGPDAFVRKAATSGAALTKSKRRQQTGPTLRQVLGTFRGEVIPVRKYRDVSGDDRPRLGNVEALALEMALNEEAERRALEGELAALEAAWREAEEIARIADALPAGRPPGDAG
ncbi:MAG TPA: hypothetical protein VK929_13435 [Longimicrobiales bacterium]|nr:hypothetical protein [Longimicrobiales bacterium]